MWEKNLKESGCVYMYKWIILWHRRNYHNIVNQLYFNKALKMQKKKKLKIAKLIGNLMQLSCHFYFLFFCPFRAAPAAHGGSQVRGPIEAVAAGPHHSHSNPRSKPCL